MDEPVRWVTKTEAAEELEISFSTLASIPKARIFPRLSDHRSSSPYPQVVAGA